MNSTEFQRWLARMDEFTPSQCQRAIDTLVANPIERKTAPVIEDRLADDRRCPHCNKLGATRRGFASGLQRYRCCGCGKTFNALTGTPLAGLRKKEKWLGYTEDLQQGTPLKKTADKHSIHVTTAFRWRHRFLKAISNDNATELTGIAEADETYFLLSFKGQRTLDRPARKRGGKAKKPGLSKEQVPVLIARDRHGETFDQVLSTSSKEELGAALLPILGKDTILCSDGSPAIKAMASEAGISHQAVNLKAGIRVKDGVFHVQNVNSYDSRLKERIRRFKGVATKYLGSYLGWYRFSERHPDESQNPKFWFIGAMGPAPG